MSCYLQVLEKLDLLDKTELGPENKNTAVCEDCNLSFDEDEMERHDDSDTGYFWFQCIHCFRHQYRITN